MGALRPNSFAFSVPKQDQEGVDESRETQNPLSEVLISPHWAPILGAHSLVLTTSQGSD